MGSGSVQSKEFCDPMAADTGDPSRTGVVCAVLLISLLRCPGHCCCVSARTLLVTDTDVFIYAIVYFSFGDRLHLHCCALTPWENQESVPQYELHSVKRLIPTPPPRSKMSR